MKLNFAPEINNVEHWVDQYQRLGLPLSRTTNLIRISADNLLKLHKLKIRLTGKSQSLFVADQERTEK